MRLNTGIVSFYLRRVLREPLGLLIFTALPVAVVWVMSAVYSGSLSGEISVRGYNMVSTNISIHMMLLFQMNSGIFLLNYIGADLFGPRKWRLMVSPRPAHVFVFSAAAACTIFTFVQGLLVVGFTAVVLNAYWGNPAVTALTVLLISLVSQLMNVLIFLITENVSATESLSWILSIAMVALGGTMFPLPDTPFFRFLSAYGTPIALGRRAIVFSGFLGEPPSNAGPGAASGSEVDVWICLAALAAVILALSAGVAVLGRRKPA